MELETIQVYITRTASFLPNEPVTNEEMEAYLGFINGRVSKSKNIVLRNNGIMKRYYAMRKDGSATHTNSEMTALAIQSLFKNDPDELKSVQLLACGTSTPDQMIPSHAVMVHGWLSNSEPIEVVSPSGVCCSGMHALKYAYMSIKCGEINKAVATGSERVSRIMRAEIFEEEVQHLLELKENPYISFEKEFLRWMLSDGAGAILFSNKKVDNGINLRIDWVEGVSYAHQVDTCMYMACDKQSDGSLKSYLDYTPDEILKHSVLSIKQDIKLLSQNIIELGFDKLKLICEKRNLDVNKIDFFLPHMSSEFFRTKINTKLNENGIAIPKEKWFTNLSTVGNVGAGSIFIMLDELIKSEKLNKGNKILIVVPESARFSFFYALLTVC